MCRNPEALTVVGTFHVPQPSSVTCIFCDLRSADNWLGGRHTEFACYLPPVDLYALVSGARHQGRRGTTRVVRCAAFKFLIAQRNANPPSTARRITLAATPRVIGQCSGSEK